MIIYIYIKCSQIHGEREREMFIIIYICVYVCVFVDVFLFISCPCLRSFVIPNAWVAFPLRLLCLTTSWFHSCVQFIIWIYDAE